MYLLIKNGTVVTATDTYRADIRVSGEKIVQIGNALDAESTTRVIDATGKYVLPAGIDPHTHLPSPGQGTVTAADYPSGTVAAACGGTPSLITICFLTQRASLDDSLNQR